MGSRTVDVLCGLNLEMREGEMLAVVGASGSGKSTFLHLVGGMDRPDSGEILFKGQDVTALKGAELARFRNREVGLVFQMHHLLPEFSALENVMFPMLLGRGSRAEARERALSLLSEVGLQDRAQHQPGELSGGEQQRVAVARALAARPRLLLADEPTGNLDRSNSQQLCALIQDIHERHQLTSIIATHDSRVAELCSRQKKMSGGQLHPCPDI